MGQPLPMVSVRLLAASVHCSRPTGSNVADALNSSIALAEGPGASNSDHWDRPCRSQSWLWHHRNEFVEHGSLAKQRMRALFGGVGFEMTVISESLTCRSEQWGVAGPVGAGFVESLARPGGNATGFMFFEYSIAGK
jgi:hypothetical protein